MNYEIEDTGTPVESQEPSREYPRIDPPAATRNVGRAMYLRMSGHTKYAIASDRCERIYLGSDGSVEHPGQWEPEDWASHADKGIKPAEMNMVRAMVNAALGYQIANRMDVHLVPMGQGANDEGAGTLTKVIKQVLGSNHYHWKETEMVADGLIRQRGYLDVRMDFSQNAFGQIKITEIDGLDVMLDDMGNTYDPNDGHRDITISRWLTADDIEVEHGAEAADMCRSFATSTNDYMAGDDIANLKGRFGDKISTVSSSFYYDGDDGERYFNVIERQYRSYEETDVAIYPTGDIVATHMMPQDRVAKLAAQGCIMERRKVRVIRWFVTTYNVVLYDDLSPYSRFTLVPFFPYFRRGRTRGMVDGAINPQELLNKTLTELKAIMASVAQSGWVIQDQSLANMGPGQAKTELSKNGAILWVKPDTKILPQKIAPPPIPAQVTELIAQCISALQLVTGMDETLTAAGPVGDQSGVAYQARQYAAQQKLAVVLDNLARSRTMLAMLVLEMVQKFMSAPMVMRITETDLLGKEKTTELPVNQPIESGDYMNDLTVGKYDLVIDEQPMQITFDNSQFKQVESLINMGYPIPPEFALRYSNLNNKTEIAKAVSAAMQSQPDPLTEAKVKLTEAQAIESMVNSMNKRIEAVYGATQAGVQIAGIPGVASIADEVLQSAGFDDQNASPIIPQQGAGLATVAPEEPIIGDLAQPTNTNPITPANPAVGVNAGIEKPGLQI